MAQTVRTVLLVDDEADIRTVAAQSLSLVGGCEVIEARDGHEALAQAREMDPRPDVILLDVMMPGMDGPGTFEKLQADPRTSNIPVIFMTAKAQTTDIERYLELGAIGVVTKPFDPMQLPVTVESILSTTSRIQTASANDDDTHVLLVDDDPDVLELFGTALRDHGFVVHEASSLAEARIALHAHSIDISVVDGVLGDGMGVTLLGEIRERDEDMMLVLMSAHIGDPLELLPVSRALDIDIVMAKGFSPDMLVSEIEAHRRDQGSRQAHTHHVEEGDFAALIALREGYRTRLSDRVAEIARALARAAAGESEAIERAMMLAHRMHGTAGTYRCYAVSEAAARIEARAAAVIASPELLGAGEAELLAAELDAAARSDLTSDTDDAAHGGSVTGGPQCILVVDADEVFRSDLTARAHALLIDVLAASTGDEAFEVARRNRARIDGAIIDLHIPGRETCFGIVNRLLSIEGLSQLPIAFISQDSSIGAQRHAAQMGSALFLHKPLSNRSLADAVQKLQLRRRTLRPRVLILDDDPDFGSYLAAVLEAHGIQPIVTTDPITLLNDLEEHNPEMVLLDINMPHISGIDLCRMIRASDRWSELPVLFMTADTSLPLRRECFEAGGDDYVQKPIFEAEVVARVRNRVERARLAREIRQTDSLTGLSNRRATYEQLDIMSAIARRANMDLTLAMIDLDAFKQINDTYGHGVGDEVLRGFGQLLRTTYRRGDACGRVGGEEFLVAAVSQVGGVTSALSLDRLRERLAEMTFGEAQGDGFQVTFSAGAASFNSDSDDIATLIGIADRRLYRAKELGRNMIVTTDEAPAASHKL